MTQRLLSALNTGWKTALELDESLPGYDWRSALTMLDAWVETVSGETFDTMFAIRPEKKDSAIRAMKPDHVEVHRRSPRTYAQIWKQAVMDRCPEMPPDQIRFIGSGFLYDDRAADIIRQYKMFKGRLHLNTVAAGVLDKKLLRSMRATMSVIEDGGRVWVQADMDTTVMYWSMMRSQASAWALANGWTVVYAEGDMCSGKVVGTTGEADPRFTWCTGRVGGDRAPNCKMKHDPGWVVFRVKAWIWTGPDGSEFSTPMQGMFPTLPEDAMARVRGEFVEWIKGGM